MTRTKRALIALVSAAVLAAPTAAPAVAQPATAAARHHHRPFCKRHRCIPNFYAGHGYIVQCRDGMWSHSGGRPGACSYHRGVRR
jgi:opacity protein-like surface antigen